MTTPTNEAARIAGEGVPIPTRDGELRLVYGMQALRFMEDRYGSIAGMQTKMQGVLDGMTEGDGNVAAFGPLCDIIGAGLLHLGYTQDRVDQVLLPRHTRLYAEAMQLAMREAFPDDDSAPQDGQGNAAGQVSSPGPGVSGTTSPPAATAAPMATSGA